MHCECHSARRCLTFTYWKTCLLEKPMALTRCKASSFITALSERRVQKLSEFVKMVTIFSS